ncbi:hypothetical protein [Burkholderia sp. Nafp2/4-1b]|uniref:hypothetical protein n=1 Tax=Burkholderia sp. Nafp2/4-1b TaxID=2116686 RepID=UPI0013CEF728|nr:hypothetical protein [Burkholderia sp. Nafp2/4-1b]
MSNTTVPFHLFISMFSMGSTTKAAVAGRVWGRAHIVPYRHLNRYRLSMAGKTRVNNANDESRNWTPSSIHCSPSRIAIARHRGRAGPDILVSVAWSAIRFGSPIAHSGILGSRE